MTSLNGKLLDLDPGTVRLVGPASGADPDRSADRSPELAADRSPELAADHSDQDCEPEGPPTFPEGWELAPGYRVKNHINRGQALDVYEVFSDERLCSCIAKVVRPDRREVRRVVDRLQHEGQTLLRLGHPHLVRCWEVLEEPQPTLILQTIPGTTLEEAIEDRLRRYTVEDLAHLGRHLCSALHYLHAEGVLHLDIRPANIMAEGGIVKLIDLSLARAPGPARGGRGTRHYMAPEQAAGGIMSAATDVWGIGATMYEAATGEPPFAPLDEAEDEIYGAQHGYLQLLRPAPPLRYWRRRLPRTLRAAIESCLQPDPEARPGVDELYATLGTVLDDVAARQAAREAALEAASEEASAAEFRSSSNVVGQQVGAGSSRR
ncbi:MAG TPA: serine/threonine-protein kinase [Actinomycetales bacterium]|nr:serine/threonine-protein kinase [Actinomycetales bacterium]